MSRLLKVFICLSSILLTLSTVDAFPTCEKHFRGGVLCTGHYGHKATAKAVRALARRQSCLAHFSSANSTFSATDSQFVSSTVAVIPTPSSANSSPITPTATAPPSQVDPSSSTIDDTPEQTSPGATPTEASPPAATPTAEPDPTTSAAPAATSSAASSSSSDSGSITSDSDISEYLADHNNFRAQYGAAPLTWSNDLAAAAQTWANNCVFKHSGGSLGPYGENLAAGTGSSYGIDAAIKSWTDESSSYDPSNPQASHFTQVVWKGTTQVGCAVAECSGIFPSSYGQAQYYVCEYSPQGNVIGEFAENVQA